MGKVSIVRDEAAMRSKGDRLQHGAGAGKGQAGMRSGEGVACGSGAPLELTHTPVLAVLQPPAAISAAAQALHVSLCRLCHTPGLSAAVKHTLLLPPNRTGMQGNAVRRHQTAWAASLPASCLTDRMHNLPEQARL